MCSVDERLIELVQSSQAKHTYAKNIIHRLAQWQVVVTPHGGHLGDGRYLVTRYRMRMLASTKIEFGKRDRKADTVVSNALMPDS